MAMSQELWNSLEAVEESINKIVCLKQVLMLYPIINEEVVEILEALILDFSDKQKKVWEQVRNLCLKDDDHTLLKDEYRELKDKYIALEKKYDDLCQKYDNLALYESYGSGK